MSESDLKLRKAPIVEAVLDLDCDLSAAFSLEGIERDAASAFGVDYPRALRVLLEHHRFEKQGAAPAAHRAEQAVESLRHFSADGLQLVQVRSQGYSFNRLKPYAGFEDYWPEIERTWAVYRNLVAPLAVRAVRLRYINRIDLPSAGGDVNLDEYLATGPRLPDGRNLVFAGFLHQYAAIEEATNHRANIILTSQSFEGDVLPVIFDIAVTAEVSLNPADTGGIRSVIESLRSLKNRIFREALTERCLRLFQE